MPLQKSKFGELGTDATIRLLEPCSNNDIEYITLEEWYRRRKLEFEESCDCPLCKAGSSVEHKQALTLCLRLTNGCFVLMATGGALVGMVIRCNSCIAQTFPYRKNLHSTENLG